MARKPLRYGFTTGSAAAAGAKAGILCLAGRGPVRKIDIPLPMGGRLTIPIAEAVVDGTGCVVTVVKDGGDDPDVTHRIRIKSIVGLLPEGDPSQITILGGEGVGMVTRRGLSLPVGESAINPVPRQQIRDAVSEGLKETGLSGPVSVTIEAVNGERIAQKTLNPRLGIVGGISILGTRGTVKPFSNKAYTDTITVSMDVAKVAGVSTIALTTGGRSERFLKEKIPTLPDVAFVQVADFFSFSVKQAAAKGFADILYACFFGKLVKMAQGHPYTHARKCEIDFDLFAHGCWSLGMKPERTENVARANTAREALGIILDDPHGERIMDDLVNRALVSARGFTGPLPDITYYLFDFGGGLLASKSLKGSGALNHSAF
ncbi:MAG: cobalt-precorrin-5B (C(1))-methyltransferase [Deltaproteobacteria bacterium]|nr:cobalt-precorrin-5B (C(1))-methyltransferase [Deltaproteobacteria bacterium]